MPDTHYENAKLAELYDLDSPWSVDREFYLSLAGKTRQNILDLGCGTGLLCNSYAEKNHDVTGVDPSPAMLEIARQKPHGRDIEWVLARAQNYESDKRFDLIIMTGHAFQVLLEDDDVRGTFSTMRAHIKPGGKIVFESRNPKIDWSKEWNYEMNIELSYGSVRESRQFKAMNNDLMTFELHYQFPDETLVSQSTLRFWHREEIEKHLTASDLYVDTVVGDWDGKPFVSETSHELIFTVRPK